MTPFPGAYAPYAMPYQAGGHTVAYGLMTPPESPEKPSGRGLDFHHALDARSSHLMAFDLRQGMFFGSEQLGTQAVNHPVRILRVSIGPLCVDITNERGMVPTVQDVAYGLARALKMSEATPQEVAVAVSMGFVHPSTPVRGTERARLLDARPFFGGFTLRTVQHDVAIVDCHLRARV
ncbi:hypothetical protein BD311DRAFT_781410 [Dichomitus squalens]|uniref:Uncharacterized protein n=1 Tax=Dichomitus squalens TaxID=114155 RepID=A0A4Q9MBR5_9APHY|nr:hypothetical protein BD311DRAFT_781410 [Dichomitus squalens]